MIHTRAVREAIGSRSANGELLMAAPEVDEAEVNLPKVARTNQARLQSVYCSSLNTFKHHIDLSHPPGCHTTGHIFECPEHPTNLIPLDLRQRPGETVEFLKTWPCLNRLYRERPHLSLLQPHSKRGRAMKIEEDKKFNSKSCTILYPLLLVFFFSN